jgi:SPP1 family predicted phage head-tail adaptor
MGGRAVPGPLNAPRRSQRRTVGAMRHRLALQRANESVRDEYKQVVPAWGTVDTVWAAVVPVRADEVLASGQVQADATHKVVMRYRADASAKSRFLWLTNGSRVLNVVAVLPTVGDASVLELLCVCEETAT